MTALGEDTAVRRALDRTALDDMILDGLAPEYCHGIAAVIRALAETQGARSWSELRMASSRVTPFLHLLETYAQKMVHYMLNKGLRTTVRFLTLSRVATPTQKDKYQAKQCNRGCNRRRNDERTNKAGA